LLSRDRYRRHRLRPLDYVVAVVLLCGYLGLLMGTMDIGFTRDEGYYFHASRDYYGWFQELSENAEAGHPEDSFRQESVDRHWGYNPEHPVLLKTLFGLSWAAFSQDRQWMSPSTAMRFPAAIFSALLLSLVFLFFVEAFGSRGGGLFAAAALGFMPRFFFHAHLSCFDAGMATMWFLVVYAYWRSHDSRLWGWLTGVFFGIALITKLNAFFIPLVLLLHWGLNGLRTVRVEGRGLGVRLRIAPIPLAFVAMVVLGPLIFYLGWPRHWFDTFNRIAWYVSRHWNHEHYYVQYFGEALVRPPFDPSFPWVMTLITVPAVCLATALLGGVRLSLSGLSRLRRSSKGLPVDQRGTGILIALNVIIPIALIGMPETPIFGGTKHWIHAMPFLAIGSGIGALWAFRLVWPRVTGGNMRLVRSGALSAFLIVLAIPLVHATLYAHPYGTSYFNELVGGIRGAADAGQMRQYWGYSTRAGLAYLDEVASPRERIFPHNANPDAMRQYRADGLSRNDLRDHWGPEGADFAFFNHQRAFLPVAQDIWRAFGTMAPRRVWTVNGVPILSLYENQTE
jgi:hypothetical protein